VFCLYCVTFSWPSFALAMKRFGKGREAELLFFLLSPLEAVLRLQRYTNGKFVFCTVCIPIKETPPLYKHFCFIVLVSPSSREIDNLGF